MSALELEAIGKVDMNDALLTELENLAGLIARGQLTQPRKVGARIAAITAKLRTAGVLKTEIAEKIAAFPLEDQNVLKHDHEVIYGFNAWRLTVGDVRQARQAAPSAAAAPPEEPAEGNPAP